MRNGAGPSATENARAPQRPKYVAGYMGVQCGKNEGSRDTVGCKKRSQGLRDEDTIV